jgi:hypothetical protein
MTNNTPTQEEQAKKTLLNIKADVQHFLENVPKSRNNDRLLTVLIRRKHLGSDTLNVRDVMRLPTQESIKRMRAKFQEQGLYLPTDPVILEKRQRHATVVKSVLRG